MVLLIATTIFLFSGGCNVYFWVSKDNVIRKQEGYLLLSNQYSEFIPIKIDTSLSMLSNLNKNKMGLGFYLYNIPGNEIKYLLKFADTVLPLNFKIIPVELEYRRIKETNTQLRASENNLQKHSLIVEDKRFFYEIGQPKIYYINSHLRITANKKKSIRIEK